MKDFSWGLFVALAVSAIFIALGASLGPVLFFGVLTGLIVAFRYTYFSYYAAIALMPFLGLTLSIPTGELAIGKRAFGGSIDISVADAFFLAVLAAWALKIIFLWVRRHDRSWMPVFPLIGSYAALFFAHAASALSPLLPDPVLVLKFAMRPVLFCYLAFIALPANLLRSRRRLIAALSVFSLVGLIGALNGTISLFFVDASSQFIRRAHPLPMFGIPALGDNHNLLAELMAVTVLTTVALAMLVKHDNTRRLLYAASILQGVVGLLTFSRTVWIVFACQAIFLAVMEYRETLVRRAGLVAAALVVLVPLALVMAGISSSNVAESSNSTRFALLEIAFDVFRTSPLLGSGAGTFVERVGSAQVFRLEYGDPLDAHGFLQKLAAETGLLGLAGFACVMAELVWIFRRDWPKIKDTSAHRASLFLMTGAGGAIIYQLFNTNYWTGKMWLPIGLTLTALHVFTTREDDKSVDFV